MSYRAHVAGLFRRRATALIGVSAVVFVGLAELRAAPGDIPPAARVPPPREWFDQLTRPGQPIVYTGKQLRHLTFPLGGIGTGTVWLHGSGRLVNWQIFNNIQRESQADDTFFAVRIQEEGRPPIVRVLQQSDVGPFRGIRDIHFRGEYPVATLTFHEPGLPVEIELEAFNPLIPHNEKDSGLPCAIFTLRAHNKTDRPVHVSLLASVQNAVNHTMRGSSVGTSHITYGGNVNRAVAGNGLTAVAMSAMPGRVARIEPPIALFVDHDQMPTIPESLVAGCRRIGPGVEPEDTTQRRVYWLARGDLRRIGGAILSEIARQVRSRGALLILEGEDNPLACKLQPTLTGEIDRRERVFADFDGATYGNWRRQGKSFKQARPKSGAVGSQARITGFLGAGLANSYYLLDVKRGRLLSRAFTIEHKYISFLVGGGQHPGLCCVNLTIDEQVVHTATGRNSEHLERIEWDVAELMGRKVRIEIKDEHQRDWGQILADDIRFSDLPIDAVTADDADAWNALLAAADSAQPETCYVSPGRQPTDRCAVVRHDGPGHAGGECFAPHRLDRPERSVRATEPDGPPGTGW